MPHWTFDSNQEGWSLDDGMYYSGLQHSLAGTVGSVGCSSVIGSLSYAVNAGDVWSCRVRMIGAGDTYPPFDSNFRLEGTIDGALMPMYDGSPFTFSTPSDDSGWITLTGTLSGGGTLSWAAVLFYSSGGDDARYVGYADDIYIADTTGDLRLLRMAADNGNLYVSGIESDTLSLYTYGLAGLAINNTETFGTCAYTAPDTFTNAIYPAATMVDNWVFVYGRDGNNKQVQFSSNGGITFSDVGPGTATWATTKFCASLMVAPLNPVDIVAAFYDNDIYQSVAGTAPQWTKRGDNPSSIRVAGRHPNFSSELLTAGTAAGTIHYTPNWGQSFTAVGGTVIAGTINAIAVSRW